MSMINRQYRDIYQQIYSPKKTFEYAISEYLDDPVGLRDTMRHSEAVITGSFALRCICGENWEIGDMDIFVPKTGSLAMKTFLMQEEGYELVDTQPSQRLYPSDVSHV
jgi:hypothetical protein